LHYCVEDPAQYRNKITGEDFMSSSENFDKYLSLIMATVPASSKKCGLSSFGNQMP